MVDVTQAMESNYLTADVVKSAKNKKAVITSEGKYEDVTYDGVTNQRLTLTVDIERRGKIWRPNRDSVANLANKFGRDSKLWFQKIIEFSIVRIAGKDCIVAVPSTPN